MTMCPLRWRRTLFATGAAGVLILVTSPPVDAFADRTMSVHMGQHMVLIDVVAPLIAASCPGYLLAPLVHRWARPLRRLVRARPDPMHLAIAGWTAYLVVLWAWHAPPLYEAALAASSVHALEHASMVVAAYGLWRPVLGPPAARRVPPAVGPMSFATAAVHSGLLGALLVFARSPWFASAGDPSMGLEPLADQQLAGVVLWTASAPVVLGVIWWSVTSLVLREQRGWRGAGIG